MIAKMTKMKKAIQLITIIAIGIFMVAFVVVFAHKSSERVFAAGPIPPPVGYPKLTLSTKAVTPTLAKTDGAILEYNIQILNTGAFAAMDVSLVDAIPNHTQLEGEVKSSASPAPEVIDGVIHWQHGEVGFDDSVAITYSVKVDPGYEGVITNTAVISDPMIAAPVTLLSEARITDKPLFEIAKMADPQLPGKNTPLTYELVITNHGQPAVNTPITVTDFVPADTTFRSVGPDGMVSPDGDIVTWTRTVDLDFGETIPFTFSVDVGDVVSGTIIHNGIYYVDSPFGTIPGEPVLTKVSDPILSLSKSISPDPPGSNREVTYTLTVLNLGSKATSLVITDTVPAGIEYLRGGDGFADGVVTWSLASLGTNESAQVTFTGMIGDVANATLLNDDYAVCSAEGVCAAGAPVESQVLGPTFKVSAEVDPTAKKPGDGTVPVTPTLTIQNLGPGNALDANALVTFGRINVSKQDMVVSASNGTLEPAPCAESFPCWSFLWTGNISVGDIVTFTTDGGQNTVGGGEGTPYTATVVVTDDLGGDFTETMTATAVGHVTHHANLVPTKTAPAEIGAGQTMTYTIQVFNSGLSTEESPPPVLTETVPASVTLMSVSDGGISNTVDDKTVITWTLPAMRPGETLFRSFEVMTDPGLVNGTLIVNDDYRTTWYESEITGTLTLPGEPVTTTIHVVGLVDSYKTVTPSWALPGKGTVLTYEVHVVNSGPNDLKGVKLTDIFPWEHTTYQRDAVASAGSLVSDIVSLEWTGDVAPYSEELITFTTLVDDYFAGVVTNTATISHTSLAQDAVFTAVAYITDKPLLRISSTTTPDPVDVGAALTYQIELSNLGEEATNLVVTDTVPVNTVYIDGSASSGGTVVGNDIQWNIPALGAGEKIQLTFQVVVQGGDLIINDHYSVRCEEGVSAFGEPVITRVLNNLKKIVLPLIQRD